MKIHEWQAKEIFRDYGISTPVGKLCQNDQDIEECAQVCGYPAVVKAQILAGGRGKAGGVVLARDFAHVRKIVASLLGKPLVTGQSGQAGAIIRAVLVENAVDIARELYVAITLDRSVAMPVLIVSSCGGMDIEQTAVENPGAIKRLLIDPRYGLRDFQARDAASFLGFSGKELRECARLLKNLYRLYDEKDAILVEINPLALTGDGDLMALDAKLDFDDNALFRHPELKMLEDRDAVDSLELVARENGLSYIRLSGNIGVMVNGAGLAMATMDLINQAGGAPADFLDVGGGARAEKIAAAFRIILADSNVKAIFINIFGGILRCDFLAQGIVQAARETAISLPLIIRMLGTNSHEGREILEQSGLSFQVARDLAEAGSMITEAIK